MKEFRTFTHPEFGTLRVMKKDGEVYFAAEDVAKALGYASTEEALAVLNKENKEESARLVREFCDDAKALTEIYERLANNRVYQKIAAACGDAGEYGFRERTMADEFFSYVMDVDSQKGLPDTTAAANVFDVNEFSDDEGEYVSDPDIMLDSIKQSDWICQHLEDKLDEVLAGRLICPTPRDIRMGEFSKSAWTMDYYKG